MSDQNSLRIAVRKLDAFEHAIGKQWADFCRSEQDDLNLEIVPFNIPDLHTSLFEKAGLKRGNFDIAFVVTDWIAEAAAGHHLVDLQSYLKKLPPENYPHGWDPSLLRIQTYGNEVYGNQLRYNPTPHPKNRSRDSRTSDQDPISFPNIVSA